jgi:hypothetical protein
MAAQAGGRAGACGRSARPRTHFHGHGAVLEQLAGQRASQVDGGRPAVREGQRCSSPISMRVGGSCGRLPAAAAGNRLWDGTTAAWHEPGLGVLVGGGSQGLAGAVAGERRRAHPAEARSVESGWAASKDGMAIMESSICVETYARGDLAQVRSQGGGLAAARQARRARPANPCSRLQAWAGRAAACGR